MNRSVTFKAAEKRIARARKTFDKAIDQLARDVRKRVVIPLCRKHRCRFFSGNGMFWFETENGTGIGNTRLTDEEVPWAKGAMTLLNMEIDAYHALGDYIEAVEEVPR